MYKIGLIPLILILLTPTAFAYQADFSGNGTSSCDSYESGGGGFPCSYLTDNNLATRWISANTAVVHWWKGYFNTAKTAEQFRLNIFCSGDCDTAFEGVDEYSLQGSNNDSDWTSLIATTTLNGYTDGDWLTATFTNSTAYNYYRFSASSTQGNGEREVTAWEIELMEDDIATSSTSTTDTTNIEIGLVLLLAISMTTYTIRVIKEKNGSN